MTDLRTAAQQALEALEEWHGAYPHRVEEDDIEVAEALRAALAEHFCDTHCTWADHAPGCKMADGDKVSPTEPVQEPVAWMVYTLDGKSVCVTDNPADFTPEHRALPLYAAPPQRKENT